MRKNLFTFIFLSVVLALTASSASAATIFSTTTTLAAGDPTQLGRLSRNGVPSDWSANSAFPGVLNGSTSFHYRTFSIDPLASGYPYVQISVDDPQGAFFVAAYLDSYTPASGLNLNYLGDPGSTGNSFGNPSFFQVLIPAGHQLVLVVVEPTVNGGIGKPLDLRVEGFTDTEYTDIVNTPPTFTPASAINLRQGGPGLTSINAGTVADSQTPAGSLTVTQIGGGTATGVTVTGVSNSGGTVTADLAASCGATAGTVRFQVSDGTLTATGDLPVNILPNTPPSFSYTTPAAIVYGQSLTVSPAAAPTDNGSIMSYVIQSQGTYTGGIAVDNSGVVSITNPTTVGTHTITVRATDNCGATTDAPFQLTVTKASTTTSLTASPAPTTYGQSLTMTATTAAVAPGLGTPAGAVTFRDGGADCATGVVLGSGTLNGSGVATLSINNLTAGAHTIRACYGGGTNHNASSGSAAQTVNKAVLTVTASSTAVTYGDAVPAITPGLSGFVLGESSAVLAAQPTCSTAYAQGSGVAGSPYATSCSGGSAANYSFSFVNGSVAVNKAVLTVTADNKTRTYGAANPTLTQQISGFVLGQNLASSGVTGTPVVSTAANAASAVGQYPITVAAGTLAASNYAFTFANGTLSVTPATLTVTADNKSRLYGSPNPAFTYQIAGFQNGETLATSGVTGAPALSTAATQFSAPGVYPIVPAAGTIAAGNYAFSFVNGALTIGQAASAIAITNAAALVPPTSVGQGYTVNFAVSPTSGSGVPTGGVTVTDGTSSCTATLASVNNGTGSCLLASSTPGNKTITASYTGDANYTGSVTAAGVPHQVVILLTGNVKQYVAAGGNTNLAGATATLTFNGIAVSTAR